MPGIHHEIMLDRLETVCLKNGLRTWRNVASHKGRDTGYIDLLVSDESGNLLLIEYETDSPKRVFGDVLKRRDMGEDVVLWIVCPTERLARRCRKMLRSLDVDPSEPIKVLTFCAAMQRLKHLVSFCSLVVGHKLGNENKKPKTILRLKGRVLCPAYYLL